jgi:hypothetical protein
VADKIPASHSDVTLPLEEAFSSRRELAKGCTFFIALVGTISAINGLTMLIVGKSQGRAVLLFSGAVWLLWIGLRAAQKIRERARIAQPAGQIRLTSSEIAVPKLSGEIETVRWMDLREVRLTRDTAGTVYYEFYAGNETPSIVLTRSRVKNPEALDRELERRIGKVKQTFEWERVALSPPVPESWSEIPPGERFDLSLPSKAGDTLRSCGGLLLALAVLVGLGFAFSGIAIRWMSSSAGIVVVIAVLLLGVFLATRSAKAWIVCAADGLHVRARGTSFPPFIPWSDLRDHTFVATGGRYPTRNLTVWTSTGSWKLENVRIKSEEKLLSILRQRSARKPNAFMERVGASLPR